MSATETPSGTAAGTTPATAPVVLVGLDGSPPSRRALEWAAAQAELMGATLWVISTWEWPTAYGWSMPIPSDYDPTRETTHVMDEVLAPVRAAHTGLVIRADALEGHPAPVLVEASRDADLLVVGCRGHGEFAGMLLGSVSEHCAAHAHCPVVIVRGAGRKTRGGSGT